MFSPKEKVKVPRSLRSARLSVVKNQISTPVIQTSTPSLQRVIKALYDYQAQSPNELSFSRGDFFLVTITPNNGYTYEAFNPITNSRGSVPIQYFQVVEKHEKSMVDSANKKDIQYAPMVDNNNSHNSNYQNNNNTSTKPQPLYGIVLYDFNAERSDELDAKAGEPIIIIAQSNAEWFVAKPIGRLGGPGLIPVSFVDIRDASTGRTVKAEVLHTPASFPNVEDWKKQTLGYEASSISVAKLEKQMQNVSVIDQEDDRDPVDDYFDHGQSDYMRNGYGIAGNGLEPSPLEQPITATASSSNTSSTAGHGSSIKYSDNMVISAYIDSHILEGDQYWFIVFARLANGRHRVLYRLYEDFYDFQMNFLQEFPTEAGKRDRERVLPYMPGPLDSVNDEITVERARDLSVYCSDLLKLPQYLSESTWVQDQLFGIHEGDIETETDPSLGKSISNDYALNPNTSAGDNDSAFSSAPVSSLTTTAPVDAAAVPSTTSSSAKITATATPNATMKVKIVYKDEMFAIKVPIPSTFEFLQGKILDRLGFNFELRYKDSENNMKVLNEEAFEGAVKKGKLTVHAS